MSADGSPQHQQRGTFATGRISRTRPWTDDNPVLERAYTQGGSHAAKALLPWRSIAAISRQASVLGLRAPDNSMLARQREDAKLARVFPNTAALDEPISPRERVRIVLRLAGAPMVPRAVADRLRLPLAEAAALFQALADDGELITVAVGDRQGLITLRHMPDTADPPLRAARHHGSRIAPAARRMPQRQRHQRPVPGRAAIVTALRKAPQTIEALCAVSGLSDRSVREHIAALNARVLEKTTTPAGNGRRQRKAHLYALLDTK